MFDNNIILSSSTGNQETVTSGVSGYAYYENDQPALATTIQNNVYYNSAGGQVDSSGQINSDSNPIVENPDISGPTYQIASDSPVLSGPVDFTPISGNFGPPGFSIPDNGNESD